MRSMNFFIVAALLLFATLALLPTVTYASNGQWVKYSGNPVLTSTPGGWDASYTVSPKVLFDGQTYRMWYQGGTATTTGIGYATSTDGITWRKHNGPVLTPGPAGAWDSAQVALGSVIWNGTSFLMWYSGSDTTTNTAGAVGFATSQDGISWTKDPHNPILSTSGLDQQYMATPYVISDGVRFNMWYTGKNATSSTTPTTILYALSFGNTQWVKWSTAVLAPSSNPTMWDSAGVYSPSVLYDGTNYDLWYTGFSKSQPSPQIGFATSPDGANWTRSPLNPILSPGPLGSWDSAGVEQPSVIQVGKAYVLYYDGFSTNSGGRIGFARSPLGTPVPEFPISTLGMMLGISVLIAASVLGRSKRAQKSAG